MHNVVKLKYHVGGPINDLSHSPLYCTSGRLLP